MNSINFLGTNHIVQTKKTPEKQERATPKEQSAETEKKQDLHPLPNRDVILANKTMSFCGRNELVKEIVEIGTGSWRKKIPVFKKEGSHWIDSRTKNILDPLELKSVDQKKLFKSKEAFEKQQKAFNEEIDKLTLGSGGEGRVIANRDGTVTKVGKGTDEFQALILRKLTEKKYPNAPKFIEDLGYNHKGEYSFKMEKIEGQNALKFVEKASLPELVDFKKKALTAAKDLNKHGIANNDLTNLENIMIDKKGKVYFVDWGMSLNEKTTQDQDDLVDLIDYYIDKASKKKR